MSGERTFTELEHENVKLRASLIEANRLSTELAMKLATAGQLIGFQCDQTPKEIAAQVRLRLRLL